MTGLDRCRCALLGEGPRTGKLVLLVKGKRTGFNHRLGRGAPTEPPMPFIESSKFSEDLSESLMSDSTPPTTTGVPGNADVKPPLGDRPAGPTWWLVSWQGF